MKRFSDKDDALQWGACVSLSTPETAKLENATATEIITESVKQQVVSALKNYTDIGMNAPMNSPSYYFAICIPISQSIKYHCIHPQHGRNSTVCSYLALWHMKALLYVQIEHSTGMSHCPQRYPRSLVL